MAFKNGDVVVVLDSRSFYTTVRPGDIGVVIEPRFVDFGGNVGIREIFPWHLRLATKLDKLLAGIEHAD